MATALALTALILAVPSFFLSVYNTFRLTLDKRTTLLVPENPAVAEGALKALQGERTDVTAGSDQIGAPSSYSFGMEEDNF